MGFYIFKKHLTSKETLNIKMKNKRIFIPIILAILIGGYFAFNIIDWFSNLESVDQPLPHKNLITKIQKESQHKESFEYKSSIVSIYNSGKNRNGTILFDLGSNFDINPKSITINKKEIKEPSSRIYKGSFFLNRDLHFSFPIKKLTNRIEISIDDNPKEELFITDKKDYAKIILHCTDSFNIKLNQESKPLVYFDKSNSCSDTIIELYSFKGTSYLLVSQKD